ncbi:hypothetical protein ACTFIV_007165 [Dictyostelium citrinum]
MSNISKVSYLLGKFKGTGLGEYPTISPFNYTEEIEFSNNGKPFIFYQQKTWNANGQPLHSESGYMRFPPNGKIELVISEPTGITEIYDGELMGENNETITFKLTNIQRTPTAKPPHTTNVIRKFTFDQNANTLSYTMDMATTTTTDLTHHLSATLQKQL